MGEYWMPAARGFRPRINLSSNTGCSKNSSRHGRASCCAHFPRLPFRGGCVLRIWVGMERLQKPKQHEFLYPRHTRPTIIIIAVTVVHAENPIDEESFNS